MDKPRLLSGRELVARGVTKTDASLPEAGLKDVVPNGSWLEQKQIQSALEARKQVIEVERIQKSGVLSHAEWREELMLAEVTRMAGGHWQYLGHNIGKQLYLKPEEALFLIEVNCLKLTYNDVTVSMQQAYSLLLRSKVSLLKYKVYASLSRIGYKVYKHEEHSLTKNEKKNNVTENLDMEVDTNKSMETDKKEKISNQNIDNSMEVGNCVAENAGLVINDCEVTAVPKFENDDQSTDEKEKTNSEGNKLCNENVVMNKDCSENTVISESPNASNDNTGDNEVLMEVDAAKIENKADYGDKKIEKNCLIKISNGIFDNSCDGDGIKINKAMNDNLADCVSWNECGDNNKHTANTKEMEIDNNSGNPETETNLAEIECKNLKTNTQPESCFKYKLQRLENRKLQAINVNNIEKYFEKVPDIAQKQTVTVFAPVEEYIPRNVFLNNTSYMLNLDNIRRETKTGTKSGTRSTDSRSYSTNEEVNGEHIKRIKAATSANTPVTNPPPLFTNNRFSRPPFQNFWRPNMNFWRPNMNFFPNNFMFQRPFMPNFIPRFRVFNPRPSLLGMYPGFTSFQPNAQRSTPNENKRRRKSADQKDNHLNAIKGLAMRLRHLVQSGNTQQQNIDSLQRLISTFNVKYHMRLRLTDNFELFNDETIVETITLDEEEEPSLKKSKTEDEDKYKENFNKLKQLALKFKELQHKEEANSRHRRAFSSLIKKFNKAYNADVYLNSNFLVIDRKFIDLDSSSDSDCVIEENAKTTGTKKLKNPFNILKRLSEKQLPGSKKSCTTEEKKSNNYSTTTIEIFCKNWLPSEDDFGRAEIMPRNQMNSYLIQSKKEEFLYEFLKSQPYEFENWLDIKLSFLKSIEETNVMIENETAETHSLPSLIEPEDCVDMPSILKKLSIINQNTEVDSEPSLYIDFDVYNRDVQNFRKSNRPKPHFRVVCVSETSSFPSGRDVASLHSNYKDNVSIVFAVVGVGSISYLQINPVDLPVYIPSNDLD